MVVVARIIGVIAMMVVAVVAMMVVVMMIAVVAMMMAVPGCGGHRTAGRDCANNA